MADLPGGERCGKPIEIVLRVGARARDGAHVDHHRHLADTEQRHEVIDRAGRMADILVCGCRAFEVIGGNQALGRVTLENER